MNQYEFLNVSLDRGIATITLNRPPLNVLHQPMLTEINTALETLLSDRVLGAIVFRANGKAFSAGVDIADHTEENAEPMLREFHDIFRKLAVCDVLTVAAVDGAALGGGCELACFCDIILASERSKFGQPEIKVGVFPPIAACTLPAKIGLGQAIEFTTLGETIKADEALRIGLVNHVYPVDDFEQAVNAMIDKIAHLSRPVIRLTKKATTLAWRDEIISRIDEAEAVYLNELMRLNDAHEGIAAFIAKREPAWQHA